MAAKKLNKKEERKLGIIAATTAIIGLIGGLFFLSPNITGNAVGVNELASNIVGIILLFAGLVGSFFWLRSH